jgi:hypothetical protein
MLIFLKKDETYGKTAPYKDKKIEGTRSQSTGDFPKAVQIS